MLQYANGYRNGIQNQQKENGYTEFNLNIAVVSFVAPFEDVFKPIILGSLYFTSSLGGVLLIVQERF